MTKQKTIKFKYVPMFGIRQIDPFEWNEANGYVQAVPMELAAVLHTYPKPEWEIAEENVEAARKEIEAFIETMPGKAVSSEQ